MGRSCYEPRVCNKLRPTPHNLNDALRGSRKAAKASFPFWNVGENSEPKVNVEEYGFVSRTQTQVGNGCSNPGCKAWSQGMFPTSQRQDRETVNGGVPQNARLESALEKIEESLPGWISRSRMER